MIEFSFFNLYYYLSQSLLGYITNNIIAILVEYDQKNEVALHVYLGEEPSSIDKENMFSAFSEADGYFDKRINYDIKYHVLNRELTEKEMYNFWLFMRYSPALP